MEEIPGCCEIREDMLVLVRVTNAPSLVDRGKAAAFVAFALEITEC